MLYIGERYFAGYEEKFVLRKNGTLKKVRVYLGDVYSPALTKGKLLLKKLSYVGLILCFFAVLFLGGTVKTGANSNFFVTLPYAVGLLAGGYCAWGVYHFVFVGFKMTVYQYNEFRKQIKLGSRIAATALVLAAVCGCILLLVTTLKYGADTGEVKLAITAIGCNMICGAIMLIIGIAEDRAVYQICPGKSSADSDCEEELKL